MVAFACAWLFLMAVASIGALFAWMLSELSCWWARGNGKRDDD